jgi:hypothetical protein
MSAMLTVSEIQAMLRAADADWPRLGRMQCGELADVAVTATRGVTRLAPVALDMLAVIDAARAWQQAREVLYASNGTGKMAWAADRCIDRQNDLDAALTRLDQENGR